MKSSPKLVVIHLRNTFILALVVEILIYLSLVYPKAIPHALLPPFRYFYLNNDRRVIQVSECAQYDKRLFYSLKPGKCTFANREFSVSLSVNTRGFRDDEASLENPSIIALGDSHTMGWGVQQGETFPQRLEGLSKKPVLNTGMSSYGTAREMIILNSLSHLDPDFILLQYHSNDFEENKTFLLNNELPIRSEKEYQSLKKSFDRSQFYYPFKNLYGFSKGIAWSIFQLKKPNKRSYHEEAKVFLEVLKNSGASRYAGKIIIFKIDHLTDPGNGFIHEVETLQRLPAYANLGLRCLKVSESLLEEDYFILDDHLNPKGHSKIATILNEALF